MHATCAAQGQLYSSFLQETKQCKKRELAEEPPVEESPAIELVLPYVGEELIIEETPATTV